MSTEPKLPESIERIFREWEDIGYEESAFDLNDARSTIAAELLRAEIRGAVYGCYIPYMTAKADALEGNDGER